MAKKKSAAKSGKTRGMPQKQCPQCHSVQHARKVVCSSCGYAFPAKIKAEGRGKGQGTNGKARAAERAARDSERLAMEFVLFSQDGNIAKAIEAVEGFEYSKLAQFIDAAGGKQQAASALAMLKQRYDT